MGLTFQKADAQGDLDWWSRNHGTGMPQNWPMFEERKHANQKLHKRTAVFRKSATEQTKLDALLLAGMPSSEPHKLEILHFDVEHDPFRKSETTDSDNHISFNTDECLKGVLHNNIYSRVNCDARSKKVVNIGEQPQDGNFSPTMEPVESILGNSGTEVVYCEILDESVRNQVASDYISQESKLLGQSSKSDGVLEPVEVDNSRHTDLGQTYVMANGQQNNTKPFAHLPARTRLPRQDHLESREYNEFPLAKRTSSSRSHEQASAPSNYPANQNHVNDNTDYSHQNEINPFNDYNTSVSEDFSNPSVKDEWDIEPPPIEDAGIPVRALYDFQGVEEDELNFKEGDVLTQLSSQDDQGWCQGRFQGKVGHFPGSYVEPL